MSFNVSKEYISECIQTFRTKRVQVPIWDDMYVFLELDINETFPSLCSISHYNNNKCGKSIVLGDRCPYPCDCKHIDSNCYLRKENIEKCFKPVDKLYCESKNGIKLTIYGLQILCSYPYGDLEFVFRRNGILIGEHLDINSYKEWKNVKIVLQGDSETKFPIQFQNIVIKDCNVSLNYKHNQFIIDIYNERGLEYRVAKDIKNLLMLLLFLFYGVTLIPESEDIMTKNDKVLSYKDNTIYTGYNTFETFIGDLKLLHNLNTLDFEVVFKNLEKLKNELTVLFEIFQCIQDRDSNNFVNVVNFFYVQSIVSYIQYKNTYTGSLTAKQCIKLAIEKDLTYSIYGKIIFDNELKQNSLDYDIITNSRNIIGHLDVLEQGYKTGIYKVNNLNIPLNFLFINALKLQLMLRCMVLNDIGVEIDLAYLKQTMNYIDNMLYKQ